MYFPIKKYYEVPSSSFLFLFLFPPSFPLTLPSFYSFCCCCSPFALQIHSASFRLLLLATLRIVQWVAQQEMPWAMSGSCPILCWPLPSSSRGCLLLNPAGSTGGLLQCWSRCSLSPLLVPSPVLGRLKGN